MNEMQQNQIYFNGWTRFRLYPRYRQIWFATSFAALLAAERWLSDKIKAS